MNIKIEIPIFKMVDLYIFKGYNVITIVFLYYFVTLVDKQKGLHPEGNGNQMHLFQ